MLTQLPSRSYRVCTKEIITENYRGTWRCGCVYACEPCGLPDSQIIHVVVSSRLFFFPARWAATRSVPIKSGFVSLFLSYSIFSLLWKATEWQSRWNVFFFFFLLIFNRGFSFVSSQTPSCWSLWFALAVFNCLVRRGIIRAAWLSIKGEHMIHKGLWSAVCDTFFILSDVTKTNNKRACSSLWHSGKSNVIVWDSKAIIILSFG